MHAYTYVQVHVCIGRHVNQCVCVCGGQRSTLTVVPQEAIHLDAGDSVSQSYLELDCLSLPPQHWYYICAHHIYSL